MKQVKELWESKPLYIILLLAIIFRLIAVLFSQGYGFHDDHYLVIEAAQSWIDGTDYNDYLPKSQLESFPHAEPTPQGHSFFYVGINYVVLGFLEVVGITNPKTKMYFVRFLHALFSLIIVIFGYKLVEQISNKKNAREVGILLAMLWFMPFFSVRNTAEFFCIPLLILSIYFFLKDQVTVKQLLWAGFFAGLSFSIRYQISFYLLGFGIVLLFQKKWKELIWFVTGSVIAVLLTQGLIDYFIWKRPFAELEEYIRYNIRYRNHYGTNTYSMYFLVIWGLLIPPISFLWSYGFVRLWKKYAVIVIPILVFFIFHTLFTNKQERFIMPIIPVIVIFGIVGWNEFMEKSKFWSKNRNVYQITYGVFWTINIFMLIVLSFTYSKKSRVETMVYLSQKDDVKAILCEDTNVGSVSTLPSYYLDNWLEVYKLSRKKNLKPSDMGDYDRNSRYVKKINAYEFFELNPQFTKPNYLLFYSDENLEARLDRASQYFSNIEFEAKIEPSKVDILMRKMNPTNDNKTIYIYKSVE